MLHFVLAINQNTATSTHLAVTKDGKISHETNKSPKSLFLREERENGFSVKPAISATPLLGLEWAVRALNYLGCCDWLRDRLKSEACELRSISELVREMVNILGQSDDSILGNPLLPDLMVDRCKPGAAGGWHKRKAIEEK